MHNEATEKPRIGVVVVHYNAPNDLKRNLDCLFQQRNTIVDVTVVDNRSEERHWKSLPPPGDQLRYLRTSENYGGSGGFHCGLRDLLQRGGFDALAMVDCDAFVDPGCFEALYECLISHPRAAIVGAAICIEGVPGVVQETGASIDWRSGTTVLHHAEDRYESLTDRYEQVDYVPACCLLAHPERVRAEDFIPDYFLYYDDIHFCTRARSRGFEVWACRDAIARHRRGSNAVSPLSVYFETRNRYYFFENHSRFWRRFSIGFAWQRRWWSDFIQSAGSSLKHRHALDTAWDDLSRWRTGAGNFFDVQNRLPPAKQSLDADPGVTEDRGPFLLIRFSMPSVIEKAITTIANHFPEADLTLLTRRPLADNFRPMIKVIGADIQWHDDKLTLLSSLFELRRSLRNPRYRRVFFATPSNVSVGIGELVALLLAWPTPLVCITPQGMLAVRPWRRYGRMVVAQFAALLLALPTIKMLKTLRYFRRPRSNPFATEGQSTKKVFSCLPDDPRD